jgi:hypothetical protein
MVLDRAPQSLDSAPCPMRKPDRDRALFTIRGLTVHFSINKDKDKLTVRQLCSNTRCCLVRHFGGHDRYFGVHEHLTVWALNIYAATISEGQRRAESQFGRTLELVPQPCRQRNLILMVTAAGACV